jgi:hypothetical protein
MKQKLNVYQWEITFRDAKKKIVSLGTDKNHAINLIMAKVPNEDRGDVKSALISAQVSIDSDTDSFKAQNPGITYGWY